MIRATATLTALLVAVPAAAQSVVENSPGVGGAIAITNATLHPVTSAPVEKGTILFREGRIVSLGTSVEIPSDVRVVDGTGLHVYPGMIDSGTRLGLTEVGAVRATSDVTELGEFNPNALAGVAINPHTNLIPVTRTNGITAALTRPEGGIISGHSALIRLAGWTPEEMRILDRAAMHIQFPITPRPPYAARTESEAEGKRRTEYEQAIEKLRRFLRDGRAYARALGADGSLPAGVDRDLVLEALVPALNREVPVVIHADWEDDIRAAIRFAREENLRVILAGGADVQRAIDVLSRDRVPVLLGPIWRVPLREDDPYDQIYTNAAALHQAGIPFAIQTGEDHNVRNLPYQAAACAAFGLPKQAALEAITIAPARIFGVDDRLGSLEPGKSATLIVTDGDPLDLRTRILQVFIDGEAISMENHQTLLRDKFEQRNRRVLETMPGQGM